jgi:hypothetical protein
MPFQGAGLAGFIIHRALPCAIDKRSFRALLQR